MKTYSELTTEDRHTPCQEYPGKWLLYEVIPGLGQIDVMEFDDLTAAKRYGIQYARQAFQGRTCGGIGIYWECSENDPRIGQDWFSTFYCHGKFNLFGQYTTI